MRYTPENISQSRRALRRAMALECDVLSDHWDETISHVVRDLSPYGAWLETSFPIEIGAELLLSLTSPKVGDGKEILVMGRVARASLRRRKSDGTQMGMGIDFLTLNDDERAMIAASLRGLPPPVPLVLQRGDILDPRNEWATVDAEVEVVLSDRAGDIIELSDDIVVEIAEAFELRALAPLMTGGMSRAAEAMTASFAA